MAIKLLIKTCLLNLRSRSSGRAPTHPLHYNTHVPENNGNIFYRNTSICFSRKGIEMWYQFPKEKLSRWRKLLIPFEIKICQILYQSFSIIYSSPTPFENPNNKLIIFKMQISNAFKDCFWQKHVFTSPPLESPWGNWSVQECSQSTCVDLVFLLQGYVFS